MALFHAGNGEIGTKIVVALEPVTDDWFRRALIGALELMCNPDNWDTRGTATVDYARDKANEMLEGILIDVIIPVMPVGVQMLWPTATPPAKWLICDGSAVSRATYAALFAVLGTVYGVGNGTTTFNLPDFRDRSPMGVGTSLVATPGATNGVASVALTISQLPSHDHDFAQVAHNHGVTDPGHTHNQRIGNAAAFQGGAAGGNLGYSSASTNNATRVPTDSNTTGISTQNASAGITFHAQGSGANHNNLHPVLGENFIIYAGA